MTTTIQHDVVIIGGGGAGLRAAIAVAQQHPELDIAMVSKVYPMRSHTVAAEGGSAGVIRPEDSLDDHCNDTIGGADWLADQDAVEAFVNEAPRELVQMEHWGCPWSRNQDGTIATRPFGGMKIERTWYASDKTGFHMLHTLFQTSIKYTEIKRYDEWFASKLLVENGRCQGVVAIELRSGRIRTILAKSIIMCTGGAGRVFPFTTNGAIKTGDGMAVAYRAGVALKDMEFVQYHPTGLPGTGILITEAARAEGGILVNKDGRRYLQDYGMGPPDPWPRKKAMELGPRDRLSQAFIQEMRKGNTIKGKYGPVTHLEVMHLGEKHIDKRIPFVRELCKLYAGIDPVYEPIAIRPVVHYFMGGIDTDINGATSLPGLFAAGECACVSINGANRLGSNSLTELLVFGKRAGEAAAAFAKTQGEFDVSALEAQASEEHTRIRALLHSEGSHRPADLRIEMTHAMEDGCGIYRTDESLQVCLEKMKDIRERSSDLRLDDRSVSYNTDLTNALELDYMLDVALSIVHSAIARTESRGSHQREDHPERDDEKFLCHSMAYRTDGDPRIEYKDVVITRWPPGERIYGSGK